MKLVLTSVLFLLAGLRASAQQTLTVAAAADLQPVMTEIVARFEKEADATVKLSFGSSGNFFAQIQNGAPYDLFFSADLEYPSRLQAAGLSKPGSLYVYATGKIVLWTRANSDIDAAQGLKALADPHLQKIAIANPAHAPYGRAAEAALKNSGFWDRVSSKLVLGENIAQTAQFVESGNADVGIVALSFVLAPALKDRGRYFIIPQSLYPPLQQGAVILKSTQHPDLARRFLAFMRSGEISSLLHEYGFSTSEARQ